MISKESRGNFLKLFAPLWKIMQITDADITGVQ